MRSTVAAISSFTSRVLLGLNLLSLDAPLVALAWQDVAARWLSVDLPAAARGILILVTWLAYAGDRLLDAHSRESVCFPQARHRFAVRWQRELTLCWALLAVMTCVLAVIAFAARTLLLGGLLTLGALLYLVLAQYYRFQLGRLIPRELVVGVVFTLAVLFFPVQQQPLAAWSSGSLGEMFCLWTLLASLNCLGISCWEQAADLAVGEHTLATRWPCLKVWYPRLLGASAGVIVIVSPWSFAPSGVLCGSLVAIALLWTLDRWLSHSPLAPPLADLALLSVWFCHQFQA